MINNQMGVYQTDDTFSFQMISYLRPKIIETIFHPTNTENEELVGSFSIPKKSSDTVLLDKIGNYTLAYKLRVEIIKENDLYISKNDEFNVWGEGNTPEEAIKSLENFMLYDYNSYKDNPPNKLDFCARIDLKKYEYILQINNDL